MQKKSPNTLKQVMRGGGVTLLGDSAGQGLRLLTHILLSRVLGPFSYGFYALGKSLVDVASNLATMGFKTGVMNFTAIYSGEQNKARLKGTIIAALTLPLLVSIGAGVLIFATSSWIASQLFNKPDFADIIKAFSFSLPFYTLLFIAANIARGFRNMKYYNALNNLVHPLANLILVAALFILGFRLGGAIIAFVLSSALSSTFGLYWIKRTFSELGLNAVDADYGVKRILNYSLSVLGIGVSRTLMTHTDRIMLGALASAGDVGLYSVAVLVSNKANLSLKATNAIFPPIIADLHNRGKSEQISDTFKSVTKVVLTLTLPVIIILWFAASEIMSVFGPEYVYASQVLQILCIAQLVNVGVGSVGYMLIMTGKEKVEIANSWIIVLLNIILNYLLIPLYGIIGAAVATGVSISLLNIVRLIEVSYIHGFHPYKMSHIKTFVSGVLACLTVIVLKSVSAAKGIEILPILILGIAIYFYTIKKFGFDADEEDVMEVFTRKFPTLRKLLAN